MKLTRRRATRSLGAQSVIVAASLLTLAAPAARSEISVSLDPAMRVTTLNVHMDPFAGRIWSRSTTVPSGQVLNAEGDLAAEGIPTGGVIGMPMDDPARTQGFAGGEPGAAPPLEPVPVVIWSRSDGSDSEIMYSVWDPGPRTWRVPAFVDRVDNFLPDSAPRAVVCDRTVYLSWSRPGGPAPLLYVTGLLVPSGKSYDVVWKAPAWASNDTVVPAPGDTLARLSTIFAGNLCPTPPMGWVDGFEQARTGQR